MYPCIVKCCRFFWHYIKKIIIIFIIGWHQDRIRLPLVLQAQGFVKLRYGSGLLLISNPTSAFTHLPLIETIKTLLVRASDNAGYRNQIFSLGRLLSGITYREAFLSWEVTGLSKDTFILGWTELRGNVSVLKCQLFRPAFISCRFQDLQASLFYAQMIEPLKIKRHFSNYIFLEGSNYRMCQYGGAQQSPVICAGT